MTQITYEQIMKFVSISILHDGQILSSIRISFQRPVSTGRYCLDVLNFRIIIHNFLASILIKFFKISYGDSDMVFFIFANTDSIILFRKTIY